MPTIPTILADSFKHYLGTARTAAELSNELEMRVQWTKNALATLRTSTGVQLDATRKRVADLSVELIKLNLELIALVSSTTSTPVSRLNYVTKLLDPDLSAPVAVPAPATAQTASALPPSPAHTSAGTSAVVAGLKAKADAALAGAKTAASTASAAWPFASSKLKDSLANSGILPASKSTASATQAKTFDTETRKVYVNIRKHPSGMYQPTGKRLVRRLERLADGTIMVGIGKDGSQGWTVGPNSNLSFLDFHIGHEKGVKVSLNGAVKYLESGVTDLRA